MLVVDASSLYDVLIGGPGSEHIRDRLRADPVLAAPHVIDVEVLGIVRRDLFLGRIDPTAAAQAVMDLRDWPAERFSHLFLLERAWELRNNVRGSDAVYVALAEALGATLLTADGRLARAVGPTCPIELVPR